MGEYQEEHLAALGLYIPEATITTSLSLSIKPKSFESSDMISADTGRETMLFLVFRLDVDMLFFSKSISMIFT
jgi:hypothetical protein